MSAEATELAAVQRATQALAREYKLRKVVVVDHDSAEDPWRLLLALLEDDRVMEVAAEAGVEAVDPDDLRSQADDLDGEVKDRLAAAVLSVGEKAGLRPPLSTASAVSALQALFGVNNVELIHPDDWPTERERMLARAEREPTLFLVDYEIGDGRKGLDLVKPDIREQLPGCRFCVFTGYVEAGAEFQTWETMAAEHGLALKEFGLIAKAHLAEGRLMGFARMLKMSLGAAALLQVTANVCDEFTGAAQRAVDRIRNIGPGVLAEIVFQSSEVEGQWEADTLLRLLRAELEDELFEGVHLPEHVAEGVREARRAAVVDVGEDPDLVLVASEIQSRERYQTAAQVNGSLSPLANGDVFDIRGDYYVLVAQPCDIALRADGRRSDEASHQVLLKIRFSEAAPDSATAELPYFPLTPLGASAYAILVRPTFVPTPMLELCALHDHGRAEYQMEESLPAQRAVGAQKRANRVAKRYDGWLAAAVESQKQLSVELIKSFFPGIDNPKVLADLDLADRPILSYPIARVARLRERPAEGVLSAYGLTTSRTAEAHDLARIRTAAGG